MKPTIPIPLGTLNPKQKRFCQSRARYTAYGGARGGGKSHVARIKAVGGCLSHPGLRVLFVRREYPELEQTAILPIRALLPPAAARYHGSMRLLRFANGSILKFGHYGSGDELEYQGQEYDWIFIDEATQFTENQFRVLGACLRGATPMPRRMYLTCNPGGIGHQWVKRLFLDRDFRRAEHPEDYTFIQATVDDNPQLMAASPEYVRALELLPEDVRRAWRYGDWNALSGTFFPEFRPETHVAPPLVPPPEWRKYRAIDYGLDMFACVWAAVEPNGRIHIYRETQQSNLVVSAAASLALALTPPWEEIDCTFAPPDLWARQKDTGRGMAELFALHGLPLVRASAGRVQGWMAVKEALKPMADGLGGLRVSSDCRGLTRCLAAIQHDTKNPSDCAVSPHDITHICDALRYFCVSRTLPSLPPPREPDWLPPCPAVPALGDVLTGGEPEESYLGFPSESMTQSPWAF